MGPGDVVGLFASLSTIIVISLIVLSGHRHRLRVKERELELEAPRTASPGPDIQQLEQRLRVLERIATDKGTALTAEIEALRDSRPVEALIDSREPEMRS